MKHQLSKHDCRLCHYKYRNMDDSKYGRDEGIGRSGGFVEWKVAESWLFFSNLSSASPTDRLILQSI